VRFFAIEDHFLDTVLPTLQDALAAGRDDTLLGAANSSQASLKVR
jgi:hypothetical protein